MEKPDPQTTDLMAWRLIMDEAYRAVESWPEWKRGNLRKQVADLSDPDPNTRETLVADQEAEANVR